ncbi:MAG TPA: hypothetical protein PKI92_02415 [Candidatus Woesebacteria bacterium]|nr:hypothetical protein [Candidatus Woesebacteria bacterium]HPR99705.1 hypothetical protein [Candidatus Woesebacteria bacterium]
MENNSPETIKPKANNTGKIIDFSRRMKEVFKDPKAKEAGNAAIRTALNLSIAFADVIPGGLGEVLDVTASIGKIVGRKSGEKPDPSKISIDLTPDVPLWVPWLSNIPEIHSGGAFPSYAIPAGLQLIKDIPRMIEGFRKAKEILKDERNDYNQNQTQIDKSIEVFTNK